MTCSASPLFFLSFHKLQGNSISQVIRYNYSSLATWIYFVCSCYLGTEGLDFGYIFLAGTSASFTNTRLLMDSTTLHAAVNLIFKDP